MADPKNEKALGQLLVLVQYQWPQQEDMFASIITTIQKRRKFNFPEFFQYVIGILCTMRLRTLCMCCAVTSSYVHISLCHEHLL